MDYFANEIALIQDEQVKDIAKQGVALIPEYFYHVPASSTGKYHPSYTVGDEGLYRHVKAAVAIAKMLFQIHNFTDLEEDMIIASLILHDGWKQGLDGSGGKTIHAHPVLAAQVLRERVEVNDTDSFIMLTQICNNIASHMGQWTTNKYEPTVILPTPKTEIEKFVHMCDYLSSRKQIEFNFSV